MRTFLDLIKTILSDKRISIAILIIAIASRVIQILFFYNIIVDGSYQYMAMQNFVCGHGFTIATVTPDDLSSIHYAPLINWPPGYSLVLAPFYWLFKPNYMAAGLALDFCSALMLFFSSRAILRLYNVPVYLINIFTILLGFYIYYFYFIESSDAIAIAFYVVAVYYTLLFFKTKKHWIKRIAVITVLLLLTAYVKYLFMPLAFIIPFMFLVEGFFCRDTSLRRAGIISFCTLTFGIAILLIYQKLVSGSATYISQPERGFFPQHLLDAYPLIPASLLSTGTLFFFIGKSSALLRIYQLLYIVFLFLSVKSIVPKFIQSIYCKRPLKENYVYLLFFISITTIVLLATLSLLVAKEEIMPGQFWTYIEEPRYYGLAVVMIHMGIFILYPRHPRIDIKKKYLFWFFIILLLPEIGRGLVFDVNRMRFFKKEEYSWQVEGRFQKYADDILENAGKKYSMARKVVTGTSYYLNHRVSLYSHIPILADVNAINTPSLQTSKPVLLLVILHKKDHSVFDLSRLKQWQSAGQFKDYYFYTVYVQPH